MGTELIINKEETLETRGFYLSTSGDIEAGISPCEWKVEGPFVFESLTEFNGFVSGLRDSWEWVTCEPVGIETFEIREAKEKRYIEDSKQ